MDGYFITLQTETLLSFEITSVGFWVIQVHFYVWGVFYVQKNLASSFNPKNLSFTNLVVQPLFLEVRELFFKFYLCFFLQFVHFNRLFLHNVSHKWRLACLKAINNHLRVLESNNYVIPAEIFINILPFLPSSWWWCSFEHMTSLSIIIITGIQPFNSDIRDL